MEALPYDPLDEIKKLGDILIEYGFEKEYFRYLHIQEQCRFKWQANNDKLLELIKEHEKCAAEKEDLKKNLRRVSQLWEMEKNDQRIIEIERNLYKMKMNEAYNLLRYDLSESGEDLDENTSEQNFVDEYYDEDASTGSFLSDISNISQIDEDDGPLASATLGRNLSYEFHNIFDDKENTWNLSSEIRRNSLLGKTVRVKNSSDENNDGIFSIDTESNQSVQSQPKHCGKYLHVLRNFSHGKLSNQKGKSTRRSMLLVENNPNPIYERIGNFNNSFEIDNEKVSGKKEAMVMPKSVDLLYRTDSKPKLLLNPPLNLTCQNYLTHPTPSRSVVRFLKKCLFPHHDSQSQIKSAARQQTNKRFISDYAPATGLSVPALIIHCVDEVETRGLSQRDIYRVLGSEEEIKTLKERFMQNDLPNLWNVDIHVICGCIKFFLRGLLEPLIPTYLWTVFSNAVVVFDGDSIDGNIQRRLQNEINHLPKANRDTLAFLILHLQRVATCAAIQMPISSLAKVFGPTVVGYSKHKPDHADIFGETIIQQNVMQCFLNIPTDYWYSLIMNDLDI